MGGGTQRDRTVTSTYTSQGSPPTIIHGADDSYRGRAEVIEGAAPRDRAGAASR